MPWNWLSGEGRPLDKATRVPCYRVSDLGRTRVLLCPRRRRRCRSCLLGKRFQRFPLFLSPVRSARVEDVFVSHALEHAECGGNAPARFAVHGDALVLGRQSLRDVVVGFVKARLFSVPGDTRRACDGLS